MAWRNSSLKLIVHDVTESLDDIVTGNLSIRSPTRFLDDDQPDLVISLNILSQLPILPSVFLEEHLQIKQDDIQKMARTIIECHLDYLLNFTGTVCLITDIEREIFDSSGKMIKKFSALSDVSFPWEGQTWIWEIAPLGEESLDYSVRHRVAGIPSLEDAIISK